MNNVKSPLQTKKYSRVTMRETLFCNTDQYDCQHTFGTHLAVSRAATRIRIDIALKMWMKTAEFYSPINCAILLKTDNFWRYMSALTIFYKRSIFECKYILDFTRYELFAWKAKLISSKINIKLSLFYWKKFNMLQIVSWVNACSVTHMRWTKWE